MYGIDLINPMIHIIPKIGRDITPIKNKGRWCIRLEKMIAKEAERTQCLHTQAQIIAKTENGLLIRRAEAASVLRDDPRQTLNARYQLTMRH